MSDVKYAKEHEWIRLDGDLGTVGISDYAQDQLGDIVFVELPAVGKKLKRGEEAAVVESVKAASEVYAPVDGEVVEVNAALASNPDKINADPLGAGWFFKMRVRDRSQLDALMDDDAYAQFVATLG